MFFTFASRSAKPQPSDQQSGLYVHAMSISHKIAVGALALSSSSVAFVGLYMFKAAAGIDLFPGPSFMHDTFYIY